MVTASLRPNDRGEAVGTYTSPAGATYGFFYSDAVYTTLNVPGSTYNQPTAVNTGGQVTGWYQDAAGTVHGFLATVPEPTDE